MKRRAKLFKWTKEKPDFPCLFITRDFIPSLHYYDYAVWEIAFDDEEGYNMLLDGAGEEWGALEDLVADEYMVLEDHRKTRGQNGI